MSVASNTAELLTNLVAELASVKSMDSLTEIVARTVRGLTGADGVTFVLRDGEQCYYVNEDSISALWKGRRFPLHACVSGWAMVHRQTILIPNIYCDTRVPSDVYRPTFVKSLCMCPIRIEDPVGAIGVYWAREHTPSPEEQRLIQLVAECSAGAIENLELREIVKNEDARALEAATHSLVHDLRSPLATIRLLAEMIHPDAAAMDKQTRIKCLQSIMHGCDRMNLLLERMLGLYRATNNQLRNEVIRLSDLARELAQDFTQGAPDRVIEISIEPELIAYGDPLLVRLVLENLFGNAIKYSSKKPKTTIRFHRYQDDSELPVFAVCDNGAGFHPEKANQLFKPLVRLHSECDFPGVGLGLASVSRIVQAHGGSVRAEAPKDGGAIFYFSLPRPPAT